MKTQKVDGEKMKVLFIGGRGRSGSTLLDLMLGQIEGFFSIGELRYFWERGLERNELCGCGEPFRECVFWDNVVEEAFGSFQNVEVAKMQELQRAVDRMLYIPKMFLPWRISDYKEKLTLYAHILNKVYKAVHKVSKSRVIIDSSKVLSHGFILGIMPDVELYVVHLVRDSRAAAYSWQRKKVRPEVHWKHEYMPRFSLTYSAWGWNVANTLGHLLGYVNKRSTLLRYEDLVNDPKETVSKMLALLEEQSPLPESLDRFETNLGANHTVAGNPMRFQRGTVKVRPDQEWRTGMSKRQQLLATSLTWPFLLKYGYLGRNKN